MEFLANSHPEFTHFPIAFLAAYVLLETAGIVFKKDFFSKTAHLLLFLGVIGLLAAALTGNKAEEVLIQWSKAGAEIPLEAMEEHEKFANISLWYFTALLVGRTLFVVKKRFTGYIKYLFIVLALAGAYFIYETADHGGILVYKYGLGTDLKKMEMQK